MNQACWRTNGPFIRVHTYRSNNHQYNHSRHSLTHTHKQTQRFLFAVAQKLTRLVSKQASESVIYLFSLAPRSRGRALITGGFFCPELCASACLSMNKRGFDLRAEAHHPRIVSSHSHLQLRQEKTQVGKLSSLI